MRPLRSRSSGFPSMPFPARAGRAQPSAGRTPGDALSSSPPAQYRSFRASLLYCPKCRQATPTRERLLLVLPNGNLYEYLCTECGTSTGSKTDREQGDVQLFVP